jgi:YidC/Oxa1 family membrane protein insertase
MGLIWKEIFIKPIFNGLIFLYRIIPGHDMGIAIIVLTLIIRLFLIRSSNKALHSQKELQKIQPEMDRIKKQYKGDKQKQTQEMMDLYKKYKINPFSSCLPLLVQFPFLIALFLAFRAGLQNIDPQTHLLGREQLALLYQPLKNFAGNFPINTSFLGVIDLTKPPSQGLFLILPAIAGALQLVQSKMMMSKTTPQKGMSSQMTYFMAGITVLFCIQFQSWLAVYWITTTLFTIGQQYIILKRKTGGET